MPIYEVEHPVSKQLIEIELDGPPTDEVLKEVFAQIEPTAGTAAVTNTPAFAAPKSGPKAWTVKGEGFLGAPQAYIELPEEQRQKLKSMEIALDRYGLPVAAAVMSGGASIPAQIAAGLLGGAAGEATAQQVEIEAGRRTEMSPEEIQAAGMSAAIPYVKAGGRFVRPIVNTALQGVGQGVAEYVRSEDFGKAASAAAKAGAFTAAAPMVFGGIGRAAVAGAKAIGQTSAGTWFQRFLAGFNRPVEMSKEAKAMADAREAIMGKTGERIPMGLSEAIGTPALANSLKEGARDPSELTSAAMDELKQVVLNRAAGALAAGRSIENISDDVIRILRQDVGDFTTATEQMIRKVADQYKPALESAQARVINEAQAIVPRTVASPAELGERVRGLARTARDEFRAQDKVLFDAVRSDPDYATVMVQPSAIKRWLSDVEGVAVKDAEGNVIPFGMAAGTKEQTAGMAALGDVPQTLEAMRNVRTRVGESFGDPNLLPGLGEKQKKALYKAISDDIDTAISATSGNLGQKLQAANAFHRSNVERFVGRDVQSVLSEFGVGTGAAPGAMLGQLQNKAKASAFITRMRELAGPGRELEMDALASEYLFNEVASGLQAGSKLPVGSTVKAIEKLAPEIQSAYFPKLKELRDLAVKEAKLADLPNPEKAADLLDLGGDVMLAELRSKDKGLSAAITGAMRVRATEAAAMRNAIRQTIRSKGKGVELLISKPTEVVDQIMMGSFSSRDVKEILNMIGATNGAVRDEIKTLFVDKLLKRSASSKGSLSAAIEDSIKAPSSTGPGGELYDRAKAILGDTGYNDVLDMVGELRKIDEGRLGSPAEATILQAAMRAVGGLFGASPAGAAFRTGTVGAANQAGYVASQLGKWRYAIASKLYTDPALRDIRSTPISQITQDRLASFVRSLTRASGAAGGLYAGDYEDIAETLMSLPEEQ